MSVSDTLTLLPPKKNFLNSSELKNILKDRCRPTVADYDDISLCGLAGEPLSAKL